jgi:UPF0755 protein
MSKKQRKSGSLPRARGGTGQGRDSRARDGDARGPGAAPSRDRKRAVPRRALGWLAAAGAAALAVLTFSFFIIYPATSGPSQGAAIEIDVDENETAGSLAQKLGAAGLVSSPRIFSAWLTATGGAKDVVKGVHLLTDDASPRELVARMERKGFGDHAKVTFPEGWNRFDMAKRLQDKHVCTLRAFLDATADAALLKDLLIEGDTAEGYLFPATYDLALDSDPAEVVRRMKAEFDRRWVTLEQRYESGALDLSMSLKFGKKEIVTLASMIEKEAAVDDERPVIASVFLNRLRDPDFKPRFLQCDPTAGYGCLVAPDLASCAGYSGKITPAINNDPDNRYSTYKREGLPPGPIANPGAKSLEAVLAPSNTRYFYFVAKGGGRHTFSETYEKHAAAVNAGKK